MREGNKSTLLDAIAAAVKDLPKVPSKNEHDIFVLDGWSLLDKIEKEKGKLSTILLISTPNMFSKNMAAKE